MSLGDDLIADAAGLLADYGEEVVYRPDGNPARSVTAVVDRDPPETLAVGDDLSGWGVSITVENNAITGISTAEFSPGRDQVSIPERVGQSNTTRTIIKLMRQDGGMATYEVR